MTVKLTKGDLYFIVETLEPLRYPSPRPLNTAQIVRLGEVLPKLRGLVDLVRTRPERGRKIFEWRIHPSIAPTQNELNAWHARQKWRIGTTKDLLRAQIRRLVEAHPDAALHGAQKKRWIRVTRFTQQPKNVDEDRTDACGGKLPVDMLKHCGIIVNDSKEWLERRAHVMKTSKGNLHILVELFEVAEIEVSCPPPQDAPAPPDPRELGATTKSIRDGGEPAPTK